MPKDEVLDLGALQEHLAEFARAREWDRFHSPKNLALAIASETGELAELFQWVTEEESRGIAQDEGRRARVADELADILQYIIRMADILDISLPEALWRKLRENEARYPVALARGNAKKYTEFTE